MLIAIAVDTQGPDAQVAMHAARAPFYLIYDGEFLLETIENPYSTVERGAAPRAAQLLEQHNVESLVAGEFGGRFIAELEGCNISAVQGSGPVSKVIQEVLA